MQSKDHWEQVYSTRSISGTSWFQEHAKRSVQLIQHAGLARGAGIIDVGGGASSKARLVTSPVMSPGC